MTGNTRRPSPRDSSLYLLRKYFHENARDRLAAGLFHVAKDLTARIPKECVDTFSNEYRDAQGSLSRFTVDEKRVVTMNPDLAQDAGARDPEAGVQIKRLWYLR